MVWYMDVLRRNTDYALRAVVHLARHWRNGPVSVRQIAADEGISYQLACKLLQKLQKARLAASTMGPKGGFELSRPPGKISIGGVIKAVQGPINLNRCLLGGYKCPREGDCPVREKLSELQKCIDDYLAKVTLATLIKGVGKTKTGAKRRKK